MELSIVIPTFNRYLSLKKALQSIVDQKPATFRFEVIVIDNGSGDDTGIVCRLFEKQIENFVYCFDDEPGQLTGRHKGTELSKGEIISFIDDDVELNPNWINSIVQLFLDHKSVSIIGGPCLPKYHVYPPAWVRYFWQPTPYGGEMCLPLSLIDIGCDKQEIDPLFVFGLNYSIRKKVLIELGGFHPDCIPQYLQKYQGDGETGLSLKAKDSNIKALYAASALLYHQVTPERLTTGYFEKWFYYNGICQSFTDIRLNAKRHVIDENVNPVSRVITKATTKARNVIQSIVRNNTKKLPVNIINLQSVFDSKYKEGYQFHQQSFNTDEKVNRWVLKEDYWNYQLPA